MTPTNPHREARAGRPAGRRSSRRRAPRRRGGGRRAPRAPGVPAAGDPRRRRRRPLLAPHRAARRRSSRALPARPPPPRAPRPLSQLGHRLRHAARALIDLAPHRIVADAHRATPPMTATASIRPRGIGGAQQTTTVELFFDLVYVFAVTQLSHQILDDLSVAASRAPRSCCSSSGGRGSTRPGWPTGSTRSPRRRGADGGDARQPAHAAALPEAFGEQGCCSRRATSRSRSAATPRRRGCSTAATACATSSNGSSSRGVRRAVAGRRGARSDQRLLLWIPALALELAAPAAGYWLPGRGRAATTDYDIEGTHFAALPGLHPHRARRIDRRHGRDRVSDGAHPDRRALPRRRVRRDRGAWWLFVGRRARARDDQHVRRPSPRARRLHLRPPADRRGIIATAVSEPPLIAHRRRSTDRRRDDPRRAARSTCSARACSVGG